MQVVYVIDVLNRDDVYGCSPQGSVVAQPLRHTQAAQPPKVRLWISIVDDIPLTLGQEFHCVYVCGVEECVKLTSTWALALLLKVLV